VTERPGPIRPPLWLGGAPLAAALWCAYVGSETRDVRAVSLTIVFGALAYAVGAIHLRAASVEVDRLRRQLADAVAVRDAEARSYRLAAMAVQPPRSAPGPPGSEQAHPVKENQGSALTH
jgi:hypothetical protein